MVQSFEFTYELSVRSLRRVLIERAEAADRVADRPFSDLDLLLERGHPLTWAERADLRDAFEASDLPFLVDVVEASELATEFRERVEAERVPLV